MAKEPYTAEDLDKRASRLNDLVYRLKAVSTALRVTGVRSIEVDAARGFDTSVELLKTFCANAARSTEKAAPEVDVNKFIQRP